jgi:DNA polymerase III gamma/tau subunit
VELASLESYYREVAQKEGLELSAQDVREIALRAEGSVRDGLSLLQKFLSGEKVKTNADRYFQLVGAIYSGDTATALNLVGELRKDEEPRLIIQTLERWFYWCSLEAFGASTPIRAFFDEGATKDFDLRKLQRLFAICLEVERAFTATPNSKIVLDMGVISLCQEA